MQRRSCFSHAGITLITVSSNLKLLLETPINFDITNSLFWYSLWIRNREGGIRYGQTISLFMRQLFPSFVSSSPRSGGWSRWRHFVTTLVLTCQVFDLSGAVCQSEWHYDKLSLLGYFLEVTFAERRGAICHGLQRKCSQQVQPQTSVTCVLKK